MSEKNYLATIELDHEGGLGKVYAEKTGDGYRVSVELPDGTIEYGEGGIDPTEGDCIESIDIAWGPEGGDTWNLQWTDYAKELMP